MEEITVRQLIEKLSKFNQDAIVCRALVDSDGPFPHYSSIELAIELKDTCYINDDGDDAIGNIISIY